ncbi:MAG: hypothetical protein HRT68_15640 [Flavobacteriaceae bacterium]|nr:hypothetical protein [Flavobacteriaceae bacterium]
MSKKGLAHYGLAAYTQNGMAMPTASGLAPNEFDFTRIVEPGEAPYQNSITRTFLDAQPTRIDISRNNDGFGDFLDGLLGGFLADLNFNCIIAINSTFPPSKAVELIEKLY